MFAYLNKAKTENKKKWVETAKFFDGGMTKLFSCTTCDTRSLDESIELSFEDSYEQAYRSSDDDEYQEYDEQQSEEEQTVQEVQPDIVENVRNMMIFQEKSTESKKYKEFEELLQLIAPVEEVDTIPKLEESETYISDLKSYTMTKSSSNDLGAYDDAREEEEDDGSRDDDENGDFKVADKSTDSSAELEYLQTVDFAYHSPSAESNSIMINEECFISLFLEDKMAFKLVEQEDDVDTSIEDEFAPPLSSKEHSSLITDIENVVFHSHSDETNSIIADEERSVLSAELCFHQNRICTSMEEVKEGREDECSIRHSEEFEDKKGLVGEEQESERQFLTIVNKRKSQVKVDHENEEKESKTSLKASKQIDKLNRQTNPKYQLSKNNKSEPIDHNKQTISNKSNKLESSRQTELYFLGKNRQLARREMPKKQQGTSSSSSSTIRNSCCFHDVSIEAGNRLYSKSVERQRSGKKRREEIRKMRELAKVHETEWLPSLHPAPFAAKPWDAKKYKSFN